MLLVLFFSSRQMQDEDVLLKYVQCCWLIILDIVIHFLDFCDGLLVNFLCTFYAVLKSASKVHIFLKAHNKCTKSAQKVHIEFIRNFVKYVKNLLKTIKHITNFTSSNTRMFK